VRHAWVWVLLMSAGCGRVPAARGSTPPAAAPAPAGFAVQPPPEPGDWLHHFPEPGQTAAEYRAGCANRRSEERGVFYIQPLGDAAEKHPVLLSRMRDYAEAFFGLPVRLLPAIPMFEETWVPERAQHNSTRIISRLAARAPADALVYAGFTPEDLYSQKLNFVFGEGSLANRCGIYSLHRYGTPDPALFLRRVLKLMSHEAGHILSIEHCVHYRCVMQGANSLREDDRHPLHLCPVDLEKLAWNTGVDPAARYRALLDFYRRAGLDDEAAWTFERLRTGLGSSCPDAPDGHNEK
jgi:archaemetzincin